MRIWWCLLHAASMLDDRDGPRAVARLQPIVTALDRASGPATDMSCSGGGAAGRAEFVATRLPAALATGLLLLAQGVDAVGGSADAGDDRNGVNALLRRAELAARTAGDAATSAHVGAVILGRLVVATARDAERQRELFGSLQAASDAYRGQLAVVVPPLPGGDAPAEPPTPKAAALQAAVARLLTFLPDGDEEYQKWVGTGGK
jgi:hypothetical protein